MCKHLIVTKYSYFLLSILCTIAIINFFWTYAYICICNKKWLLLFWINCSLLDQLRIKYIVYFTLFFSFLKHLPFYVDMSVQHISLSSLKNIFCKTDHLTTNSPSLVCLRKDLFSFHYGGQFCQVKNYRFLVLFCFIFLSTF